MSYWIVSELPTWLVGVVLILGIPALAVGAKALLRHRYSGLTSGAHHNEVAGFMVAVVGIAYAIVVGFVIVVLWEGFTKAQDTVATEASQLSELVHGSQVLGPAASQTIRERSIAYGEAVIAGWPLLEQGKSSPAVTRAVSGLFDAFDGLHPTTATQQAYVDGSLTRLHDLSQTREERLELANESNLPIPMWTAILLVSAMTIAFCLIFEMENARTEYLLVAGVAAIIAVNLFLVVELNYPFVGDISVQPRAFQEAIHTLQLGG